MEVTTICGSPSLPFVGDRCRRPHLILDHRSQEIDATIRGSPSLPFAGDQCRRPPQAHPETLIFPWDCWWHMKVWVGAQLLSPLLNSDLQCRLIDSAPKCPCCPSAPKCLRSPSAPKCLCYSCAPKGLHFPGAPWNAISTIIFFEGTTRHGPRCLLIRHGRPRVPRTAMDARAPCSGMAFWAPCSNVGPGMGAALEATCPVSMFPEASRVPTPPPNWMLYGAGRACWEGGVMSDLCPHVLCLPASCTHIWSFLFPVQLVPAVCFDFVQGVSS